MITVEQVGLDLHHAWHGICAGYCTTCQTRSQNGLVLARAVEHAGKLAAEREVFGVLLLMTVGLARDEAEEHLHLVAGDITEAMEAGRHARVGGVSSSKED